MRKIKLTNGVFILVDVENFEWLNQWKWHLDKDGYAIRSFYARNIKGKPITKHISMHRLVNKTPKGYETDHINNNKLDNRTLNLRSVSHRQNQTNQKLSIKNKSGVKGINWEKDRNKWRVQISFNYKVYNLGRYSNLEDAKVARKNGERKYLYI